MKLAVIGSKDFTRQDWVEQFIGELPTKLQLVVTGMKGPSLWAEEQARILGMPRPIVHHIPRGTFPQPEFIEYCKERNTKVVEDSDLAVCFWDGLDINTRDIMAAMTGAGKPVFIVAPTMNENLWFYSSAQLLDLIENWSEHTGDIERESSRA